MPGIDPSHQYAAPSRWRKPALVIGLVGILAFVLWTLPNWTEFWNNVSQFPALWQIPANRRTILYLTMKVASPLLIMGILGIVVWLYFLIEFPQNEDAQDVTRSEPMQQQAAASKRRDRDFPVSLPAQTLETQGATSFPPLPVQLLSKPARFDPETPLPPTLSLREAVRGHAEESNGMNSLVRAAQSKGAVPGGSNLTLASPVQASYLSQPFLSESELRAAPEPLISIRLLKDVSMVINVPHGGGHFVVPLSLNAKRVQLLAYIAWRRGELIDRDKILEHVFGWGLPDEDATEEKLSERFESHKKLLRKKMREVVIEQINKPMGQQVIDPDALDPFVSDSGFWGLSDICRVEDIEIVETEHKVIALARKDGKLVDEIPEYVMGACERLIASYPGDFLETVIKKYPGEFRAWQGKSSWVKRPYTLYRDYYLDALWYAAEYEWRMGQRYGTGSLGEGDLHKQQEHYGRAAQKYQSYAMYACNSKFDAKATFGAHGEYGERVGMSERALRRCVVLLGAIGRTDLVHQVWSAYVAQMKSAFDHRWQPSKETQADVQAAREQTNAYRFAAQVAQMSDFAERQDRVS